MGTLRSVATLWLLCALYGCQAVLYSTSGGTELHRNDDGYSSAQAISVSFPFFGGTYSTLYVCTNGVISFGGGLSSYTPTPFPIASRPVIAPFWGDVDTRQAGSIVYAQHTSGSLLTSSTSSINAVYSSVVPGFSATWAYVVNWNSVRAYPGSGSATNTFQAVLVAGTSSTGGSSLFSFVIYNYQSIGWTFGSASGGVSAQMGFDAGNRQNYYAHEWSRQSSITGLVSNSNVDVSGRWIYRVDLTEIVPVEEIPQCDTGYTGDNCDQCADGYVTSGGNCVQNHCINHGCSNGGACNNGASSYTCTCDAGWLGDRCTTRDYCHGQTCSGRGTCTNGGSSYTCSCSQTYYFGTNCESTDVCSRDNIQCNNDGTCQTTAGTCSCTSHFSGTNCNECANGWTNHPTCNTVDYCHGHACQNGATCVNGGSGYTCTCVRDSDNAYAGTYCEIRDSCFEVSPDCGQGVCSNHGTQFGYDCACNDHWCDNNGECDQCCNGWTGNDCNTVDHCYVGDNTAACANGGTCVNGASAYTCTCPYEYTGDLCETRDWCTTELQDTLGEECQHNGTCVNEASNFVCDCFDDHFTNTYCQDCSDGWTQNCYIVDYCHGHECLNGATCVNRPADATYDCTCTTEYEGDFCEQYKHCQVNNIDCNVNDTEAECINGDSWSCHCSGRWTGTYCTECAAAWTGNNCELVDFCEGRSCGQNGDCVNNYETNTHECSCDEGYSGDLCGVTDYCAAQFTPPNCDGTNAQCDNNAADNGAFCDYCYSSPCVYGTCGSGLTAFTCTCYENATRGERYYGSLCEHFDYCYSMTCQNSGTCTNNNEHHDGFECACTDGYDGKFCEYTDQCTSSPCQNEAPCSTVASDAYLCECPEDYTGANCETEVEGTQGAAAHQTQDSGAKSIAGMQTSIFIVVVGCCAGVAGLCIVIVAIRKKMKRDDETSNEDMQRAFERQRTEGLDNPYDQPSPSPSSNSQQNLVVEEVWD